MSFHLYDERTGQTTEFQPIVPGKVSIYHCGLTVQAAPHLGHIRKEVVFDVLRRWLTASGYQVKVVANGRVEVRRGGDLDHLLVTALHRAVPFE